MQSMNDFSAALKNALELVSNHPTEALAFNNLGSAFSDLNNIEAARHAFETAIMLGASHVRVGTALFGERARQERRAPRVPPGSRGP